MNLVGRNDSDDVMTLDDTGFRCSDVPEALDLASCSHEISLIRPLSLFSPEVFASPFAKQTAVGLPS